MGQLEGKAAIVTGGGTGIGKGIARIFASEGCDVVIASRNAERLNEAAAELSEHGTRIVAVPTDVTSEDDVKNLFAKSMDALGRLDILVNNSGAFDGGRVDEVSAEAWNRVIETNVTGPFLCTKEAFAIMKDCRRRTDHQHRKHLRPTNAPALGALCDEQERDLGPDPKHRARWPGVRYFCELPPSGEHGGGTPRTGDGFVDWRKRR